MDCRKNKVGVDCSQNLNREHYMFKKIGNKVRLIRESIPPQQLLDKRKLIRNRWLSIYNKLKKLHSFSTDFVKRDKKVVVDVVIKDHSVGESNDCKIIDSKKMEDVLFVVNMPYLFPPVYNLELAESAINKHLIEIAGIVKKVFDDSILTEKKPKPLKNNNISLIIGVNQKKTLSKDVNAIFENFIEKLKSTYENNSNVEFLPIKVGKGCSKEDKTKLHELKEHYRIKESLEEYVGRAQRVLKNTRMAKKISNALRKFNDNQGSVSLPKLRSEIKHAAATEKYFTEEYFTEKILNNKSRYLIIMDADVHCINGKQGSFINLHEKFKNNSVLIVATPGYKLSSKKEIVIDAAELCMDIRRAMARVHGFAPYVPEPLSAINVKSKRMFDALKFHPPYKKENDFGKGLENKHLMQNLRNFINKDENIENNEYYTNVIDFYDGDFITKVPERMDVLEKVDNKKSAAWLKTIRKLPQSHLNTLNWAQQVYSCLGDKIAKHQKLKSEISNIFKQLNPISIILEKADIQKEADIEYEINRFLDMENLDELDVPKNVKKNFLSLYSEKIEHEDKAQEQYDLVVQLARASGLAILNFLKKKLPRDDKN